MLNLIPAGKAEFSGNNNEKEKESNQGHNPYILFLILILLLLSEDALAQLAKLFGIKSAS